MEVARALLMTGLVALSGCSMIEPAHRCPLDNTDAGACASMPDSYKASLRAQGHERESVFEAKDAAPGQRPDKFASFPAPALTGMPVYQQGKVYRVWRAPWVDANGVLHAGEYVYFATPGQWNYGTLRKAGDASDLMGPVKPGALGFNPVVTPAKSTASQPQSQPGSGTQASRTESVEGVTQPYKKLTD